MTEEVRVICEEIVKNRKKPKVEPIIKRHSRYLFFDKEGKPMVALHWEKYMKHAIDKYNPGASNCTSDYYPTYLPTYILQ